MKQQRTHSIEEQKGTRHILWVGFSSNTSNLFLPSKGKKNKELLGTFKPVFVDISQQFVIIQMQRENKDSFVIGNQFSLKAFGFCESSHLEC